MPPVLGPRSPSSRRLWSWLVASATTSLPSHMTMKLASSPSRNSSMTTRAPPSPRSRPAASGRSPHALLQPSGHDDALAGGQTVGLDDDRRALRSTWAWARPVGEGRVGRRDAVAHHEGLGEGLGALQLRRGPGRAEDAQPLARNRSTTPAASGPSGPTTVSPIFSGDRPVAQRLEIGDRQVAQAARPGPCRHCPGATNTASTRATAPASRPAHARGRRRRRPVPS
jgi:hypothetical protein